MVLFSCLQPANFNESLEYVPSGATGATVNFRINAGNASEMLVVSFEGGAFQSNTQAGHFNLNGTALTPGQLVRDNDTQVIILPASPLSSGDHRLIIDAGAFEKSPSRVLVTAALSTGNWTSGDTTGFGRNTINALSHGSGKYLAGGNGGRLAYSRDSASWTGIPAGSATASSSNFPDSETVMSIAYGNGTFYAVGTHGRVSFSSDGLSWSGYTERYFDGTPDYHSINAIIYGGGKFLAAGNDGRIMYMRDGYGWERVQGDNRFGSININALAWGWNSAGKNVYVAGGSTPGGGGTGQLSYTSADDLNVDWKYSGAGLPAEHINCLAFGNPGSQRIFVLGSSGGKIHYADTDPPQADNWAWVHAGSADALFGSSAVLSIAYGGGRFIAVGKSGTAAVSTDGITWTALSPPLPFPLNSGNYDIYRVAYAGGKFILAGSPASVNGNSILASRYFKPQ
jgi:hypothetical protein